MEPTIVPGSSRWNTSATGLAPATSIGEQALLCEHLQGCRAPGGQLLAWRWRAETAHRFMAARFVTTVLLVVLILGAITLVS